MCVYAFLIVIIGTIAIILLPGLIIVWLTQAYIVADDVFTAFFTRHGVLPVTTVH